MEPVTAGSDDEQYLTGVGLKKCHRRGELNMATENLKLMVDETANIYRYLVRNEEVLVNMQFLVIDKFPFWVTDEHKTEPMIALIKPEAKTGLCLVRNTGSTSIEKVMEEIYAGKRAIQCYEVESTKDLVGLEACGRISPKRLKLIYQHGLRISNLLNIQMPSLVVVENHEIEGNRALRRSPMDKNDKTTGDFIYLTLQGLPYMIHSLAHELRHSWQQYNGTGFFENYRDVSEMGGLYIYQPEELDADAFASIYVSSLGYDGLRYRFSDMDEYNDPFWKIWISRIAKRMNEIEPVYKNQLKVICEEKLTA